MGAPEGNVDVSYNPQVEAPVPGTPECQGTIIVDHAANHVFWGIYTSQEAPEAEETPGNEKLKPDMDEREEREECEFGGEVCGMFPGTRIFDGNDVHGMNEDLHSEKGEDETDKVRLDQGGRAFFLFLSKWAR